MIEIDLHELQDLPQELERRSRQGLLQGLLAIESAAVEEAPHRTGNLVNAISTEADSEGGRVFVSDAARYAPYVHEGTGIYGPLGKPIRPTTKKALFWPGAPHPMTSVKGMRPNSFMDRAAVRAVDAVEKSFVEAWS